MSDETNTTFTPEQISQQARGNVAGLSLVAIAYLKEHALPMDEYWAFAGRRFAPNWEQEQGMSAKEVAYWAAISMVSGGCNLCSLSGDEVQAKAVIEGWPPGNFLALFGLTQEEADTLFGVFENIAEHVGYDYEWHRQGNEVTMTFSRRSNE